MQPAAKKRKFDRNVPLKIEIYTESLIWNDTFFMIKNDG